MKYGYIRPVTIKDSVNEQKKKISTYTSNIIEEQHAKNKNRNQLGQLFNGLLSPEDDVYITDLCILADSSKHLVELLDIAQQLNVSVYVINLNIVINSNKEFRFTEILHAISEFQSDIVRFRTRLGMEQSSKKGSKMGRPKRNDENLQKAIEMYMSKQYTLDEIKTQTNISRATLYRHLDR